MNDLKEILESQEALEAFVTDARKRADLVCAIDTEADSLHRYRESLCLVQFAFDDRCLLIDPLSIPDLSPLGELLDPAVVWMHGADYDMTMLKRQFGRLPAVIFDTQIGARLLGLRRFGLADLVSHYFGVELSKTSQKADWGKRPLPPKMVEYALNDVRYLLPMGERIVAELTRRGRYDWFEESCLAASKKVLERDDSRDDAWRIQGSGRLDRRGLAYLHALWSWRDVEAESWDRPSFMVATNKVLLEWSEKLAAGGELALPPHFRPDRVRRLKEALAAVKALREDQYPERPRGQKRRRDSGFERRLEGLLKTRDRVAAELDIEGSLIAARAMLESIAAEEVSPAESLLRWQLDCLGMAG